MNEERLCKSDKEYFAEIVDLLRDIRDGTAAARGPAVAILPTLSEVTAAVRRLAERGNYVQGGTPEELAPVILHVIKIVYATRTRFGG